MLLIEAIVIFLIGIGFICFPKYMRHYKTYELMKPVKDPPVIVIVFKRIFGCILLLISFILFFGFIINVL
ncbi:hypothetical protein PAECIP111892_02949 [Paenibacillus auburnensis]|uniref:Uncharacterized protein n=1 Tax=Paenibacillus auburnensis TaxID=2905649 RepID=A0ABN8GF71_9BACL|nr:hypothetical protein PAECIP111892_02949 [Paenibacillus auburnensis]